VRKINKKQTNKMTKLSIRPYTLYIYCAHYAFVSSFSHTLSHHLLQFLVLLFTFLFRYSKFFFGVSLCFSFIFYWFLVLFSFLWFCISHLLLDSVGVSLRALFGDDVANESGPVRVCRPRHFLLSAAV
jgi:hypothetical protein